MNSGAKRAANKKVYGYWLLFMAERIGEGALMLRFRPILPSACTFFDALGSLLYSDKVNTEGFAIFFLRD